MKPRSGDHNSYKDLKIEITFKFLNSQESFPLDLNPGIIISLHSDPEICLIATKQSNFNIHPKINIFIFKSTCFSYICVSGKKVK